MPHSEPKAAEISDTPGLGSTSDETLTEVLK